MDELKRLADMGVPESAEPSAFARPERFDPASQRLDEQYLGHSREHRLPPKTALICREFCCEKLLQEPTINSKDVNLRRVE